MMQGDPADTSPHQSTVKLTVPNSGFSPAYVYLVASHVNLGNLDAAHAVARRLLEIAPNFSIGGFARMGLFRTPLMEGITAALRTTELPEYRSRC